MSSNHQHANVAFILGAGRSGTTLVYKGLCMHPQVAWISNYLARFPGSFGFAALTRLARLSPQLRRAAWYGTQGNAFLMGRSKLLGLVPTPVEGEAVYTRCNIPVFPASDWQVSEMQKKCLVRSFERIRRAQGGSIFISKRTANNRRVSQLATMFPHAKFIHIIRDGRNVALSLLKVRWWRDHRVWWLNQKTPKQWEEEGRNPLELAARNWVEELREINEGLPAIHPDQLLSVSYETLVQNPEITWCRLAEFLQLDWKPSWLQEVNDIRMYNANKNLSDAINDQDATLVFDIQKEMLERLGYVTT